MANHIIDVAAISGTISTYGTVPTVVVTTPPTRVGTFARITVTPYGDFSDLQGGLYLYQGNGTAGTLLLNWNPETITSAVVLDESPVAQYTFAVSGYSPNTGMAAMMFVDQIQ